MKLTKRAMVSEIFFATMYERTMSLLDSVLKRADKKNADYIKLVYDVFLTDKEHAEFYLALITR